MILNNHSLEQSSLESYMQLSQDNPPIAQAEIYKIKHQISLSAEINSKIATFKTLLANRNISISQLESGLLFTFQTIFSLKCTKIVQNIKDIIKLFKQISEDPPILPQSYSDQPKKKSEQKKKGQVIIDMQVSNISEINRSEEKCNESLVEELNKMTINQDKISQKKNHIISFGEQSNKRNQYSFFSTQTNTTSNTYKKPPTYTQQVNPLSQSAYNQPKSNLFQQEQKKDYSPYFKIDTSLCYPIIWEHSPYFNISNKFITKQINDSYRKMSSETPLKEGVHPIKFRLSKQGTVAFGIVLQEYRNKHHYIDDKKCPNVVKYLSFFSGKGMIKYDGSELVTFNSSLFLSQGSVLQIIYDSRKNMISFYNNRMMKPFEIMLKENMRNKRVYFFIEMKTPTTQVQQL